MKIINDSIKLSELKKMAHEGFGDFVKAVVDIEKELMVIDGELHADQETLLLENGSKHEHLWGINIYPEGKNDQFIEFDSMINMKPYLGNRSRGIDDSHIQVHIIKLVEKLIKK